jgi:HEAT repeat protein
MRNVLVVYHPNDERFANQLVDKLKYQARLDAWVYQPSRRSRRDWRAEVEQVARQALAQIVVLSPYTLESVIAEHAWNVGLEYRTPIILVMIKPTDFDGIKRHTRMVDFTQTRPWDDLLTHLKDVVLTHLLKDLYAQSVAMRKSAAESLGAMRDSRAVPNLLDMYQDQSEQVRGAAVWALGQIRDKRALNQLAKALKDPDSMVRVLAADALAEIGSTDCVPDLIGALGDGHNRVRKAAADALGWLGDASAVPGLIAHLPDPDPEVSAAVEMALWELGTPEALNALEAWADNQKSEKTE